MSSIHANDLVIEFPIYTSSTRSLKKAVIHAATGGRVARDSKNKVSIRGLDGLNFSINSGERVGLVGHNGSGKSTLLRAISGVYAPVSGSLHVTGSVVSLLDLSLGLDYEATGYENIIIRGILMGLRTDQIKPKIDEIADFSELGEYLDMPVRTYSSGMVLRLAFAVTTSFHADVLIMDEWLSVGDAEFNKKAEKRLKEMVEKSSILVLASHSTDLIQHVCSRVIRLEHGRIAEDKILN